MSDLNDTNNGEEGDAERALREGLRTPALSPEAMQRIRAATQAEWRVERAGAGCAREPVVLSLAAAASVLMLAAAVGWNVFMTNHR